MGAAPVGKFEQGGSQSALRRKGDEGGPAPYIGVGRRPSQGGRRRTCAGPSQGAQQLDGFMAPPPANLQPPHGEAAPPAGSELRVSDVPFAAGGVEDGVPRAGGGRVAHQAGAADGADKRHVGCDLGPVPQRKPLGQNFNLAGVRGRRVQIHTLQRHVGGDAGPGLTEDAGESALHGPGAESEVAAGRAGGTVIPACVEAATAATMRRSEAQREPESPLQDDPELRVVNFKIWASGGCGDGFGAMGAGL